MGKPNGSLRPCLKLYITLLNTLLPSTAIGLGKYRIPSDLRSQAKYRLVSTTVGDHVGILGAVVFVAKPLTPFCKRVWQLPRSMPEVPVVPSGSRLPRSMMPGRVPAWEPTSLHPLGTPPVHHVMGRLHSNEIRDGSQANTRRITGEPDPKQGKLGGGRPRPDLAPRRRRNGPVCQPPRPPPQPLSTPSPGESPPVHGST